MASYGQTDGEGRFTLRLSDNSREGALVGEHTVIITEKREKSSQDDDGPTIMVIPKTRPKSAPEEASRIPKKWRDGSIRFTVKPGINEADFELSR